MEAVAGDGGCSRVTESPTFRLELDGRWSGGGSAVANNLRLAARLHPSVLGFDEGSSLSLIARNWADARLLGSGRYVLMPQNAWPWHGAAAGTRAVARRVALRTVSELSMRRALGVVRIGTAIPPRGRVLGKPLSSVLDEGFETALIRSEAEASPVSDRRTLVSIGSLTTYRGLETLAAAYRLYRQHGGELGLTIAGPGTWPDWVGDQPGLTVVSRELSRSEVLAAFRTAAAVIFPSTVEASPIGVMEAAEVARTLVVSDIPGHREACADAIWFPTHNPQNLAAAMMKIDSTGVEAGRTNPRHPYALAARHQRRLEWCQSLVERLALIPNRSST